MFNRKSKNQKQNNNRKKRNYARTKFEVFSKIKARLKNKMAQKEIAKDLEKIYLEPEELILIEFIDTKISKKKENREDNNLKNL